LDNKSSNGLLAMNGNSKLKILNKFKFPKFRPLLFWQKAGDAACKASILYRPSSPVARRGRFSAKKIERIFTFSLQKRFLKRGLK